MDERRQDELTSIHVVAMERHAPAVFNGEIGVEQVQIGHTLQRERDDRYSRESNLH
jgi:hypothetical protein